MHQKTFFFFFSLQRLCQNFFAGHPQSNAMRHADQSSKLGFLVSDAFCRAHVLMFVVLEFSIGCVFHPGFCLTAQLEQCLIFLSLLLLLTQPD